ncbi:MAG: hypothetical protein CMC88_01170 [Flavobacteriaceae bacterium]|nr:hypothetical protein [Flavobacteriaceae bacterium]|tara:strand:- start:23082 stop:23810 length:729 start_codon:yes stop_codon:yes gene_type:complete
MRAIIIKELKSFFLSTIGLILICSYLLINSLILVFFETNYNLIKFNLIDLNSFFKLSPWILLFIIPSICMRNFSEEISNGTLEILITKPISLAKILLAKYFSVQFIIIFCFLLCIPYLLFVNNLISSKSNIDTGVIFFGFIALTLLSSVFILISTYVSLRFKSQFNVFLVSFLICFFDYYLINVISEYSSNSNLYNFINNIGIQIHYQRLSLGIINSYDISYFILNIFLFYLIGLKSIKKMK